MSTKIEWADESWNPIRARYGAKLGWHCEHVSPGCKLCYAESMNRWRGNGLAFKPGHRGDVDIFLDEKMLFAPLRWRQPRQIFVCSMTDLFADFVLVDMIDRIFAVMALSPQHTFMVLTKRPERMRAYFAGVPQPRWIEPMKALAARHPRPEIVHPISGGVLLSTVDGALRNVWLGTSTEDQDRANERVPHLLVTPAVIRFISAEPLLGEIDLRSIRARLLPGREALVDALTGYIHADGPPVGGEPLGNAGLINLVISGGESGKGARLMDPRWARSLRWQCEATGTAFFHKQNGEFVAGAGDKRFGVYYPMNGDTKTIIISTRHTIDMGGDWFADRVGKKKAGRLLEGKVHDEMPARA